MGYFSYKNKQMLHLDNTLRKNNNVLLYLFLLTLDLQKYLQYREV